MPIEAEIGCEARPKDPEAIKLGNALRRAREDMDWTPEQAAEALGMQRPTYANYEAGNRKPRNFLRTLPKFARVFKKDLYFFFDLPRPEGLSPEAYTLGKIYDDIQDPGLRQITLEAARNYLRIDERTRKKVAAAPKRGAGGQ